MRKNDKRITQALDELGYFCSNPQIKGNIAYTHGVYAFCEDEDVDTFNKYLEKNDLETFYTDCGTDEELFLKLASEEM